MAEKISQTGHMYVTTVPSMDGDCWREEPTNAKPAVTVAEILRLCLLINGDHSVMDVHRVRDRILLGPWGRDRVREYMLLTCCRWVGYVRLRLAPLVALARSSANGPATTHNRSGWHHS
jgi:hypothetical protein